MPYIVKEQRNVVDAKIDELLAAIKECGKENRDGVLNYSVSRIIADLYEKRYAACNSAVGVLECIKQEYYRRFVGPYEDEKIKENGDVY